jgi:hypothetical protein
MRDRHGSEVTLGDIVRVLEIAPESIAVLTDDESPQIEAMLNGEYAIDDFPEPDKVSVSVCWSEGEGLHACGGLYLRSHEFELVRRASEDE